MLHPLARITSAYRFNLGWDTLTGGLLTKMFPRGCFPWIWIVVISSTCLAILSYILWYVIFTLGLWPWLVLYVVSCTSVFLFPTQGVVPLLAQLYKDCRFFLRCFYYLNVSICYFWIWLVVFINNLLCKCFEQSWWLLMTAIVRTTQWCPGQLCW